MPRTNRKGLPWSLALAALFFAAFGAAQATTINARSPSVTDVRTAIASAADGDTVIVPAGTAVWHDTLTITKGITLQGQTTTDETNGTDGGQTVLLDSDARRGPGGRPFIRVETGNTNDPNRKFRITGLAFDAGAAKTQNNNGAVVLVGQSRFVRFDHCSFRPNLANGTIEAMFVGVYGAVCGVADHNVFIGSVSFHMDNGDTWFLPNGQIGSNGDGAFAADTNFGGPDFFFVEDNYVKGFNPSHPGGGPDDLKGGRWVWRHNHMYDANVQAHGTEDGRWHGGRAREVYNNDFHFSNAFVGGWGGIRSGVTVFHDNTSDGRWPGDSMYQQQAYRLFFKWPSTTAFGGATGDNPWDVDATEPDGSHVDGHTPYLFESGTATTGSDKTHIVDSTKNWPANKWAGYTAQFPPDKQVAFIQSNTNNTLTVLYYTDSGGGHVWQPNDRYEIRLVLIALDQPGRGKGDLISGSPPINTVTGKASWPNQKLEPSYSWNNIYNGQDGTSRHFNFTVGGGGSGGIGGAHAQIVQGRDYFNDTPMPGYTPYTYPHPLTRGLPPPEQKMRNATANSEQDARKKRRPWGGKNPERKQVKKAKQRATNEMPEGHENVDN